MERSGDNGYRRYVSLTIPVIILILTIGGFAKGTFQPVYNPTLEVNKAIDRIQIDGELDDPGWADASRADNFVERSPGDMTEPEVETEALITYDEKYLYVAFKCHDDPATIRATMCQRDQFYSDDAVSLLLDTYGDAAWAYEFLVNPYGVQKDYLWSRVHGEDMGFDLIWESAARITDFGYQVEMAIPFESLRFPNSDAQTWKMDFGRNRPRESYTQYSWAAYNRDEQCWPCQWGTVNGIKNVRPGKGLELLPTFVGHQTSRMSDFNNPESPLDDGRFKKELSIGGKYSLSSSMTLEGTYNPDFSQIESDAAQIDVNTTVALFYPERRPFFQEGSDIFRTIFNSFYTRTVNDPQFAVKLTGRTNRMNIGFLSALDENTPYIIPLDDRSIIVNSGKSYVNVIRVSSAFGNDHHLGFILTDRRFEDNFSGDGGSGFIAGIDGDIRLSQNYSIVGQYITSYTKEPEDTTITSGLEDILFDKDRYTAAFNGESYSGDAFIAQFRRRARNWNFTLDYNQVAPAYRTETGYDPWNDYRNFSVYSNYNFRIDEGMFEMVTPQIYTERRWNFDNEKKWNSYNFSVDSHLRLAQTYFYAEVGSGSEFWNGVDYQNLWGYELNIGSRLNDKIGYGIYFGQERNIARWLNTKGIETEIYADVNLKPTDRLIIEPNLSYSRSTDANTGEELYSGYITRTRIQYQANRELSLRFVIQYNDFNQKWEFDPLLTYRLSSFSVFYAGSTYDYDKFEINPLTPERYTDWRMSSRQYFMKLQYMFRI
ncbi:MAG: carbohydrate binding family 9 domain-containing protein [Candidatus Zixiibacteriota bacterium]|nr:MAG: carbohydrate binding family 9 domain-containing protein [candidate division Zixibacteria bacterium]